MESAEVFVHIYADPPDVSRGTAPMVASIARSTVKSKGRFAVALAGGNTPKQLYRILASDLGLRLPWDQIHLFWGDERFVPIDDPLSNYRMVKEELLNSIRIPASNIHMISTDFADPKAAALNCEKHLCSFSGSAIPSFDLILLGMGSDGHVASLFPGTPALAEKERCVIPVRVEATPPVRISLTLPVINAANKIMVLVAGKEKNAAVQQALGYEISPNC
jgi:6-phosphogluconolactonase